MVVTMKLMTNCPATELAKDLRWFYSGAFFVVGGVGSSYHGNVVSIKTDVIHDTLRARAKRGGRA